MYWTVTRLFQKKKRPEAFAFTILIWESLLWQHLLLLVERAAWFHNSLELLPLFSCCSLFYGANVITAGLTEGKVSGRYRPHWLSTKKTCRTCKSSASPYLGVHLLQLILQPIQLLGTKALEDGILVDVPGVRHDSWGSGLTHTNTHSYTPLHTPGREGTAGEGERGERDEGVMCKTFLLIKSCRI